MTEQLEARIINLIAADRLHIPVSSMDAKLKRRKEKMAGAITLPDNHFEGERVHAKYTDEAGMKARGMKEGIKEFAERYPKYGEILQGLIAEQRTQREPTLYFGVNVGCKLTADDYMGVMEDLGFTEAKAQTLYPILMDVSRTMSRKRSEERKILVG